MAYNPINLSDFDSNSKHEHFFAKSIDKERKFEYHLITIYELMFERGFKMRHLRIKNKVRFIFSMVIIFVVLFSIFNAITSKAFSYQEPKYANITVSYGDTLWSIAKDLNGNISENIYNIQKINNLDDCNIYEGQTLLIPLK